MTPQDLSRCGIDVDPDALSQVVDHRTRLVTMGAASNGVGTVHDIHLLCQFARKMSDGNAFTFVDVPRFFCRIRRISRWWQLKYFLFSTRSLGK